MKNLKLVFAVLLLFGIAVVFNSCSQDEALNQSSMGAETSEYSKTVTIADASGLNEIDLAISSNDESVLNGFNSETFVLKTFPNKEDMDNENLAPSSKDAIADKDVDLDEDINSDVELTTEFSIVNKRFQTDAKAYQISMLDSEDDDSRRSWQCYTFTGSEDNCDVFRHSWLHRVYYKWSHQNSDDTWTVDKSSFAFIPDGEVGHAKANYSKQLKVYVKARYRNTFTYNFY